VGNSVRDHYDTADIDYATCRPSHRQNSGSLALHRFINSLNEMNNVHERRLTALRYHVPGAVSSVLVGVAMVVIGFTGYHVGVTGSRRYGSLGMMAMMVAAVIMLIVDLDRPTRGLIEVPVGALDDAIRGMPPPTR